jgi:hypothetical protein
LGVLQSIIAILTNFFVNQLALNTKCDQLQRWNLFSEHSLLGNSMDLKLGKVHIFPSLPKSLHCLISKCFVGLPLSHSL